MGIEPNQLQHVRLRDVTTFELVRAFRGEDTCVSLIISIVGREGTLRHSWVLKNGRPTADQALDVMHVVEEAVINGLLAGPGIQEVMDFKAT